MYQLYYTCELRDIAPSFAVGSEPTEKEIALATELIEAQSVGSASVALYVDEYIGRVRRAIALKQDGKKLSTRSVNKPVADLSALLEKTLQKTKKQQ